MKPKHSVYESIKRTTDAKPKAVSKASELASVDAKRKSLLFGIDLFKTNCLVESCGVRR